MALPSMLLGASALVLLVLGSIHLLYTFHGLKLTPRDAALQARMQEVSPVLTRDTTMWKAWIGFNASHSMGAMLFGLVYGYLAIEQAALVFHSTFLAVLGLVFLLGYALLGKRYWFRIPFGGVLISLACYITAYGVAWA